MAKNLNRILAGFNKTIKELHVLEEQNLRLAKENDAAVDRLLDENKVLQTEATKAGSITHKLEELVAG